MNNIGSALIIIVTGVIGLAIVAVLVSKSSQTGTVIGSFGTALSGVINAAVSPVSGGGGLNFGNLGGGLAGGVAGGFF